MGSNHHQWQNNTALASIFHRMADCYRYLGSSERFRAIAYENVSKILYNMSEDISTYAGSIASLDAISGIGEGIAEKIIEYLHTGRIKTFEQLKKKVPYQLLDVMDINGFGPATLKVLHEKMKVNTKEELITALNNDALKKIKGFGEQRVEHLKRALKIFPSPYRMLLQDALKIGHEIVDAIKQMPGVDAAVLAGSLRRKKATIGDIDIIVMAHAGYRKKITDSLVRLPQVNKVLARGTTKVSLVLKKNSVQVDIRLVNADEFGAALLYFTGSKEHNIKLRTIARNKGFKINEYGIFDVHTNKKMAGATEEEMYAFLGMRYIPPEQRLDKGEIEQAMGEVNKVKKVNKV